MEVALFAVFAVVAVCFLAAALIALPLSVVWIAVEIARAVSGARRGQFDLLSDGPETPAQ